VKLAQGNFSDLGPVWMGETFLILGRIGWNCTKEQISEAFQW
jgi:hypothetical protein